MKFHDTLNQKLFNGEELKPEVKEKLKEIANAFIEYLDIPKDAIKDVVLTGSSVSYNYTPHSDIDLHLKVDYEKVHEDCPIVEGYLWALKASFNKEHDITIYDIPVEVYAESIDGDTVHNGLYSLWQDKWIDVPRKIPPTKNDAAVQAKYEEIKEACDKIKDSEVAEELLTKIYEMRKAGLEDVGEFSTENLAFKKLRDNDIIERLKQMKKEKIDKQLSLESYNESLNETLTSGQKLTIQGIWNAYEHGLVTKERTLQRYEEYLSENNMTEGDLIWAIGKDKWDHLHNIMTGNPELDDDLNESVNDSLQGKYKQAFDLLMEGENIVGTLNTDFGKQFVKDVENLYKIKSYKLKLSIAKEMLKDIQGYLVDEQYDNYNAKIDKFMNNSKNESIKEGLNHKNEEYIEASSSIIVRAVDEEMDNEFIEVAKQCSSIYDFETNNKELAQECELVTVIKGQEFSGYDLEDLIDNIDHAYRNAYIEPELFEWKVDEQNKNVLVGDILVEWGEYPEEDINEHVNEDYDREYAKEISKKLKIFMKPFYKKFSVSLGSTSKYPYIEFRLPYAEEEKTKKEHRKLALEIIYGKDFKTNDNYIAGNIMEYSMAMKPHQWEQFMSVQSNGLTIDEDVETLMDKIDTVNLELNNIINMIDSNRRKSIKEKYEETKNYIRTRLEEPDTCKEGSFRTKQVKDNGDKIVLCKDKKTGKLKAQSKLEKKKKYYENLDGGLKENKMNEENELDSSIFNKGKYSRDLEKFITLNTGYTCRWISKEDKEVKVDFARIYKIYSNDRQKLRNKLEKMGLTNAWLRTGFSSSQITGFHAIPTEPFFKLFGEFYLEEDKKRKQKEAEEKAEFDKAVSEIDVSTFTLNDRDFEKMIYYRDKNSNVQRLADSVKDTSKALNRFVIANLINWGDAEVAFQEKLMGLGFDKIQLEAYIRKGKQLGIPKKFQDKIQTLKDSGVGGFGHEGKRLNNWAGLPKLDKWLNDNKIKYSVKSVKTPSNMLDPDSRSGLCWTCAYELTINDLKFIVANHTSESGRGGAYGYSMEGEGIRCTETSQQDIINKIQKVLIDNHILGNKNESIKEKYEETFNRVDYLTNKLINELKNI